MHLCDNLRVAVDRDEVTCVVELDDNVRASLHEYTKLAGASIGRRSGSTIYVLESFDEVLKLVGKVVHV